MNQPINWFLPFQFYSSYWLAVGLSGSVQKSALVLIGAAEPFIPFKGKLFCFKYQKWINNNSIWYFYGCEDNIILYRSTKTKPDQYQRKLFMIDKSRWNKKWVIKEYFNCTKSSPRKPFNKLNKMNVKLFTMTFSNIVLQWCLSYLLYSHSIV